MLKPLVTVGLFVLVFLLYVQPVKTTPSENGAKNNSPSAQSNIQPPSATVTVSPVNDTDVKETEAPVTKAEGVGEQGKAITRAEKVQIGISVFVALVVFWQGWIYNQQRKIMQVQKRMAAISERAYIGLRDFKINPIHNHVLIVSAVVVNGGRTPAWGFQSKTQVYLRYEPVPFVWENCPDVEDVSVIFAGGDRNLDFVEYPGVTQEILDDLNSGEVTLFVDGECRYVDFTGETQVFVFGYAFEFGGTRARAVERYQHHYPQKEKPN